MKSPVQISEEPGGVSQTVIFAQSCFNLILSLIKVVGPHIIKIWKIDISFECLSDKEGVTQEIRGGGCHA